MTEPDFTPRGADMAPKAARDSEPELFSSNAIRLSPAECAITCLLVTLVLFALPRGWRYYESFNPDPDYRIPYDQQTL